jgi:hypothetical protein
MRELSVARLDANPVIWSKGEKQNGMNPRSAVEIHSLVPRGFKKGVRFLSQALAIR